MQDYLAQKQAALDKARDTLNTTQAAFDKAISAVREFFLKYCVTAQHHAHAGTAAKYVTCRVLQVNAKFDQAQAKVDAAAKAFDAVKNAASAKLAAAQNAVIAAEAAIANALKSAQSKLATAQAGVDKVRMGWYSSLAWCCTGS